MNLSISTFTPGSVTALVDLSDSGKSTSARRFPAPWRIHLDTYREMATDSFSVKSCVLNEPASDSDTPIQS
ncbi:hypothetical protein JJV70_15840 [Streptomyces sp. JJ66]|uniref:hypothetical protein n=1 Tax=Streptomyces sp. JJ66 TaxID=2803843 RepID=UPI001C59592D|nr:hypothetical protein [Streptomyces sp. JJ66]MBW1603548.1 hypothetical protein [Streptomyces sp. JJ66]